MKAIAHREVTWWVWSLGSSNNSWTTRSSLKSLLLRPDVSRLIFYFSYNLSPMIGLQILKKICPHTQLARSMEASTRLASPALSLDVNSAVSSVRTRRQILGMARANSAIC
jgi:hypothetical protein